MFSDFTQNTEIEGVQTFRKQTWIQTSRNQMLNRKQSFHVFSLTFAKWKVLESHFGISILALE